ncbi:MAG: hypothetical protein LQ351_004136 [Letrouitia transgressa]|nr:MAG: hypothetical protein LQ351_004136 [Letrouitia transgressa]
MDATTKPSSSRRHSHREQRKYREATEGDPRLPTSESVLRQDRPDVSQLRQVRADFYSKPPEQRQYIDILLIINHGGENLGKEETAAEENKSTSTDRNQFRLQMQIATRPYEGQRRQSLRAGHMASESSATKEAYTEVAQIGASHILEGRRRWSSEHHIQSTWTLEIMPRSVTDIPQ